MTTPPKPLNEPERLAALRALCILDTPTEEQYDRLTRRLAHMLDVPIAYLALIDANRQWLKSVVGDIVCEMNRDASFCAHTILEHQPLIIPDTREDPRFADNPLVTNEPYLRFYAGIPLASPDGHNVGTLCIADHKPRHLSFDDLELLKAVAALVEEKINRTPKIFISYSHKDETWKDRLMCHLSVLQSQGMLTLWEDRRIEAGNTWYTEIQEAIESSSIAILLISANFLTSQFILGEEVPRLLERRDKEGLHLIPVIIRPSAWDTVAWLNQMNLYPKDGKALSSAEDHEIDTSLAELTSQILDKVRRSRPPVRPPLPGPAFAGALEKDGAPQPPSSEPNAERLETEEAAPQELVSGTTFLAPQQAAQEHDPYGRIKLRVTNVDDPAAKPDSLVFRQKRIIMGRNSETDLPLQQHVVSKQHAEITSSGATFHLTDLESKNFTYLNGERLTPNRPYEIRPGDRIRIGHFEITFEIMDTVPEPSFISYDVPTAFAADFKNPFEEDAKQLAAVLCSIGEQYDREASRRSREALQEALHEALEGEERYEAYRLIARMLGSEPSSSASHD